MGFYRYITDHWELMSGSGADEYYPGPVNVNPQTVAGSAAPGTTTYPIPTGALFVDPVAGSNTNNGDITHPYKTVEYAFSQVSTGGTIVLRAGEYHEGKNGTATAGFIGVALQTSNVTMQAYPDEAVWFDGSSIKTGWVVDSPGVWRLDGWTIAFDRSPTYSFGVPDDTRPGWGFVNPLYPTAAWPERVFVNGVGLTQVSALNQVGTGKFYIDQAADKVYIGTNPTGAEVRITDLQCALSILASNCTFRGFGVRRYAPSQPHLGTLKTLRQNAILENIWVEDVSCVAVGMEGNTNGIGADCIIRNCTILRSGSLGLAASATDRLLVSRVNIQTSNLDHFNYAPSTGGIKVTRLRGITVKESNLSNNYCKGFWADESVSNILFYTNDLLNNEQRGVTFELCGITKFYNNLIVNSGYNPVDFINCDEAHAWNNTVVNFGVISPDRYGVSRNDARGISTLQDNRAPMTASSVGVDTRYPVPHPDGMDWIMTSCELKNNIVVQHGGVGQSLTGVEDYNRNTGAARSAAAFGVDFDGNFYSRVSNTPSWTHIFPNAGSANPTVYFSLSSVVSATPYEDNSTQIDGVEVLNPNNTLLSAYAPSADAKAIALPAAIGALINQPTGSKHVGCWR